MALIEEISSNIKNSTNIKFNSNIIQKKIGDLLLTKNNNLNINIIEEDTNVFIIIVK
jgi:adenylyl- and sulfurtransferase ThiI